MKAIARKALRVDSDAVAEAMGAFSGLQTILGAGCIHDQRQAMNTAHQIQMHLGEFLHDAYKIERQEPE